MGLAHKCKPKNTHSRDAMPLFKTSFISKITVFLVSAILSVSAMALDFSQTQRLANQGDAKAQYNLGVMYYKGEGVLQDRFKAIEWFQKAANQGHIKAKFNIEAMNADSRVMDQQSTNSEKPTFEVPLGYRLPTKADNTNDWKRFDGPNHVTADFNGDGFEDEAYILPKKDLNAGFGVFVSINKSKAAIQSGRKFQMFKLITIDDMSPQSFAIELAEPSKEVWKTACGKGYWKCAIGEPVAVKVNNPSIMFCYIESACTIYMWDSDKLNFKEIKISD